MPMIGSRDNYPVDALVVQRDTEVADGLRLLYYFDATRKHDSGPLGPELVEAFVPSFTPPAGARTSDRLRARFHLQLQAGYTRLFMLPWNRRHYALPSGLPGAALLVGRAPLIAAAEIARRFSPELDRHWQESSMRRWQRWHAWYLGQEEERFDAGRELRR